MIVEILAVCLGVSLFTIGLRAASEEDRLLYSVRVFLNNYLPYWLYTPIIGCDVCMSSFWSIVLYGAYVTFSAYSFYNLFWLLFIIPCVAGFNIIFSNLINGGFYDT